MSVQQLLFWTKIQIQKPDRLILQNQLLIDMQVMLRIAMP
tara:strand:+ start:386 stop:505 length:120 start_codon:yes stop_codon:yes gene_type:complete